MKKKQLRGKDRANDLWNKYETNVASGLSFGCVAAGVSAEYAIQELFAGTDFNKALPLLAPAYALGLVELIKAAVCKKRYNEEQERYKKSLLNQIDNLSLEELQAVKKIMETPDLAEIAKYADADQIETLIDEKESQKINR